VRALEGVGSGDLLLPGLDVRLDIGSRVVRYLNSGQSSGYRVARAYEAFMCTTEPECSIVVRAVNSVDHPRWPLVARSRSWTQYNLDSQVAVVLHGKDAVPYGALSIDRATGEGAFSYAATFLLDEASRFRLTRYPLVELTYLHLLTPHRGLILHACGLCIEDQGFLFLGKSGAGKSTMARLWMERGLGTLLCDDRIIIRQSDGGYVMFGTPWHGDIPAVSPASVPLSRLYLLAHDTECRLTPLRASDAVSRLMSCVFTTLWDEAGLVFTLEFLRGLVQRLECYELGFTPGPEAVDFLLEQ